MHTERLSVSLPRPLTHFIDEYQNTHACKSRSEVVQKAVKLLQQKELEHFIKKLLKKSTPYLK